MYDFLKKLFEEGALTFDQFVEKLNADKDIKLANLADGGYIAKDKFDAKVTALTQQVSDLQGQVTQRDTDLADLNTKLTAAQADAGKLTEAQTALTDLQSKYDTEKQQYEERINAQAYEFAMREKANELQFTSPTAKKAFIADAIGKKFQKDGDTYAGYDEFVAKYKETDPLAFAEGSNVPGVVLPGNNTPPPKKLSLSEQMAMKNADPNYVPTFK